LPQRHPRWKEEIAFISTPATTVLARLVPDATLLHLEAWSVDDTATQITLRVRSTQATAPCPLCTTPAHHIHSHYERTLADLPWAQYRLHLQLWVRKWFCRNPRCSRRIFTERLPTVAAPWARRTLRLAQRLVALGVVLGGTAGVHLGHQWDLGVSRNTLLRLLRRQPAPSLPLPTVLGVDDFALRKRQTYGTVLIDLERRHPVALLPDRTAATFALWLREHPGVKVIARDRSTAYAEGARHGAPAATQVADRFHLLQNLREALDQVFSTHSQALDAVNALVHQQPVPLPDGAMAMPVPPHDLPRPAQQRAMQRQARRQALHAQVWALHRQGWTAPAIAQQVGLSLRTVQRDLQSATFAGRRRRSDLGESVLTPYKPYLLERWNAGCYTAMRLFRDLRQRGYTGGYGVVAAYARRLRQAQGLPPGHRHARQPLPAVAEPACQPLTPRRATWLVLRRVAKRTEAEAQQLAHLRAQQAEVAETIDLAQDFAHLVRQRQPEYLDPWLQRATTSAVDAVRRFATGLYEDYEAVKAGVTLPWNSGPVEGHINRLKMLKRQMFGRARLDLLSYRFVLAPRARRTQAAGPREQPQVHAVAA
jgi:transposase